MKLETWPIDRPRPYKRNARKWSAEAIEKVAASIREFGFRQPIEADSYGEIIRPLQPLPAVLKQRPPGDCGQPTSAALPLISVGEPSQGQLSIRLRAVRC